ncbi:juvenile hormone-binding protein-like [Aricia agestis]|uniref:juvenile hormone-binding protein-like n=1 Tax=Aricia agestis TaxID=91739 RepID=UPI001C201815|nr:juvenile hormone-binding protein-like [Aricia agestis]
MITKALILAFVLNICHISHGRLTPDFIHPCKEMSRECLTRATQEAIPEFVKGLPQFDIPPLDPFTIEKLPIQLNGITVTFHKGAVTGFRDCIVDNVEYDIRKRKFDLEFHCNITVKGQYEAKGKLLLFQIDGSGDSQIDLTNIRVKLDAYTKYFKDEQGLQHLAIKNYTYDFDYGDNVYFQIENLFRESQEWSERVLKYLNQNWREVTEELGSPVIEYAVNLVVKTVMKFFHAVPCLELVDGEIPELHDWND